MDIISTSITLRLHPEGEHIYLRIDNVLIARQFSDSECGASFWDLHDPNPSGIGAAARILDFDLGMRRSSQRADLVGSCGHYWTCEIGLPTGNFAATPVDWIMKRKEADTIHRHPSR